MQSGPTILMRPFYAKDSSKIWKPSVHISDVAMRSEMESNMATYFLEKREQICAFGEFNSSTYLFIGRYNIIALSGLVWFYDLNILHGEQQPCSCRHDQIGLRDYDIRMVWDGKLRIGSEPTPEQFWGWVLNPRMFWWSAIPLTLICRKYFFSFGVACFITRPVSNPYPWIRFTESLTIPTNIFCELAVW